MTSLTAPGALALSLLLSRLRWPLPLVRWRAAQGLCELLNAPATRSPCQEAILAALASADEAHSGALLTIVAFAHPAARPARDEVVSAVARPSLLAEVLIERAYGKGGLAWHDAHSGAPPPGFAPGHFFESNRRVSVPGIFSSDLEKIERRHGLPIMKQWAFEWEAISERDRARGGSFPYHFIEAGDAQAEVYASTRDGQSEAFLSAFLRTIAYAVDKWRMPVSYARYLALDAIPAIEGLFDLEPARPDPIIGEIDQLLGDARSTWADGLSAVFGRAGLSDMVPVSLRLPRSGMRFGSANFRAHIVSPDLANAIDIEPARAMAIAMRYETLAASGALPNTELAEVSAGSGDHLCVSICTQLLVLPVGYWANELAVLNCIDLPASCHLPPGASLDVTGGRMSIDIDGQMAASATCWLDHWEPVFPKDGSTRVGAMTVMRRDLVDDLMARHSGRLIWSYDIRRWSRADTYGPYAGEVEKGFLYPTP